MAEKTHDEFGIIKAVLWEEAKGKLRALVAAWGSGYNTQGKYDQVRDEIEGFIKTIENEEFNL